jgi:hypothetical protein
MFLSKIRGKVSHSYKASDIIVVHILDWGTLVSRSSDKFGVGILTIYNVRKQEEQLHEMVNFAGHV